MKIAVCVDGSPASKDALEEAVEFGEQVDGRIILLHSVEKTVDNTQEELIREGSSEAIDRGYEILDQMSTRASEVGSDELDISTDLVSSDNGKVNEIQNYIRENDVDYVFIGHRSLDERKEKLFGSFAKDMISKSDIPVTVISE